MDGLGKNVKRIHAYTKTALEYTKVHASVGIFALSENCGPDRCKQPHIILADLVETADLYLAPVHI